MIPSLPPTVITENYVLVSIMEEPMWSIEGWDLADLDDCDCGGPPPPSFMIPPPPRPPALPDALGVLQDIGEEITGMCPLLLYTEDKFEPSAAEAPIMAVVISAIAFLLVIVIAIVVFKLKTRSKPKKPASDQSGTIISNDLAFTASEPHPGFKPVSVVRSEDIGGLHMGLHHYTPEPHSTSSASEHLYQSISTGSETYSYSTSDSNSQNQGCSLAAMGCQRSCYQLPVNHRTVHQHQARHGHNKPENNDPHPAPMLPPRADLNVITLTMHCHPPCNSALHSQNHVSCQPAHSLHSQNHVSCQPAHALHSQNHVSCQPAHLKTNNTIYSCYTSQVTPCYTPHHTLCCALTHQGNFYPSQNDQTSTSDPNSIFKISGQHNDRHPSLPDERGLPPLPSRVESFRNHFNGVDRGGSYRNGPGRPDDIECPPVLQRTKLNNSWHSSTGRRHYHQKEQSEIQNHQPQNHELQNHEPQNHHPQNHQPQNHQPQNHQPQNHQPQNHQPQNQSELVYEVMP